MKPGPSLTGEQQEAVELQDGPYLLIAPPGSGKTEVLIRRAIHLLERSRGDLFRILALTYTHKATEELQTRIRQAVDRDDRWRVTARTFHSFAHDILENYGAPVGVAPNVAVFDDNEDKARLLSVALADEGLNLNDVTVSEWRELFTIIARLKVDLIPPASAPDTFCLGGAITLREAYDTYEVLLANAGGIDFEGMLMQAHRLLLVDPWVGEHYRRMYRHIVVDEGQEMNTAQYELLRALCNTQLRNIFVVADQDQSINAYAGGGPTQLLRFQNDFHADERHLTKNFRSAKGIVEVASKLAQCIETRSIRAPDMVAATLASGWVGGWEFADESQEAEGITEWIVGLLKQGLPSEWAHAGEDRSVTPEDICVLGRTRYAFSAVLAALRERGVETLVRTEEGGLFDSVLGRAVFYALRLIVNPADPPSRRRFLAEFAEVKDTMPPSPSSEDLARWFESLGKRGIVPEGVTVLLAGAATDGRKADNLVPALYDLPTDEQSGDLMWGSDQIELRRYWIDYQAVTQPQDRNLRGFMKLLAQLQRTVRDDPGVRILTPHRARGLEFRAVVVLGMNEGTFPYYLARSDKQIDEERRTVYVATTRASRALLLTRPARTNRRGRVFLQQESRFVAEMGLSMESRD